MDEHFHQARLRPDCRPTSASLDAAAAATGWGQTRAEVAPTPRMLPSTMNGIYLAPALRIGIMALAMAYAKSEELEPGTDDRFTDVVTLLETLAAMWPLLKSGFSDYDAELRDLKIGVCLQERNRVMLAQYIEKPKPIPIPEPVNPLSKVRGVAPDEIVKFLGFARLRQYGKAADALTSSFTWSSTPQGGDFWNKLSDELHKRGSNRLHTPPYFPHTAMVFIRDLYRFTTADKA